MKFLVEYDDRSKKNERLATLAKLHDACHTAWALRELRRDQCKGTVWVWAATRGRKEHCLGLLECESEWEQGDPRRPRSAAEFYGRCSGKLTDAKLAKRKSDAAYSWLQKKAGDQFWAKAIGALDRHNPLYDAPFQEAFHRGDYAAAEIRLGTLGWLAKAEERQVAA